MQIILKLDKVEHMYNFPYVSYCLMMSKHVLNKFQINIRLLSLIALTFVFGRISVQVAMETQIVEACETYRVPRMVICAI